MADIWHSFLSVLIKLYLNCIVLLNMQREIFTITGDKSSGNVQAWIWVDHGYTIMQAPSLGLSSYGDNLEEAESMMKDVLNDFLYSLLSLKPKKRTMFLAKLGWKRSLSQKKNYSKAHIDKKGILRNLNISKEQEKTFKEVELAI